jgi:hypothetical protein
VFQLDSPAKIPLKSSWKNYLEKKLKEKLNFEKKIKAAFRVRDIGENREEQIEK